MKGAGMKPLSLIAALAIVGCAQPGPKPLYQWDGYQAALYEHLKATGGDPAAQIQKLEAQVQKNAALLREMQAAAVQNQNIFDTLMEAGKVCSLGQMTESLFGVGGQYRRNM
jgi:hypothetical protein